MTDTTSTRPQMGDEEKTPWTVTPFHDGYNVHEGAQLVGWFADRALAQQIADENNACASLPQPTAGSTGEETRLDLVEIEARANAASPGPWRAVPAFRTRTRTKIVGGDLNGKHIATTDNSEINVEQHEADTTFIAYARTDIPALIAEVRALRASTPAQSVLVEDDYVLLPKTLTVEIACALEMAAPPPATSQAAAEQLVADYATIWSHVVALSHGPLNAELLWAAKKLNGVRMVDNLSLEDCRKISRIIAAAESTSPQPDRESERIATIKECTEWYDAHGWEMDPMNVSSEMKRALTSSNRPQATEPKLPEYKCAGGVEIVVGPCPKCGATDNDVCPFTNFPPLTDGGG